MRLWCTHETSLKTHTHSHTYSQPGAHRRREWSEAVNVNGGFFLISVRESKKPTDLIDFITLCELVQVEKITIRVN